MASVSAQSRQLIRVCSRASILQEDVEDPPPLPSCFVSTPLPDPCTSRPQKTYVTPSHLERSRTSLITLFQSFKLEASIGRSSASLLFLHFARPLVLMSRTCRLRLGRAAQRRRTVPPSPLVRASTASVRPRLRTTTMARNLNGKRGRRLPSSTKSVGSTNRMNHLVQEREVRKGRRRCKASRPPPLPPTLSPVVSIASLASLSI